MNIKTLIESAARIAAESSSLKSELPDDFWRFRALDNEIESLRNMLLAEQRRQESVKSGSNSAYRACLKLLKRAARPDLEKAWKNEADQLCACDGYVGIRLNAPKFSVPTNESGRRTLDLDSLIDGAKKTATAVDNLPSISDLKTYYNSFVAGFKADHSASESKMIKHIHNGKFPCFYRPENGPYLYVEDLLLVLDILPDAELHYAEGFSLRTAVLKSPEGEALVLPIRPNPESEYVMEADTNSPSLRTGKMFCA